MGAGACARTPPAAAERTRGPSVASRGPSMVRLSTSNASSRGPTPASSESAVDGNGAEPPSGAPMHAAASICSVESRRGSGGGLRAMAPDAPSESSMEGSRGVVSAMSAPPPTWIGAGSPACSAPAPPPRWASRPPPPRYTGGAGALAVAVAVLAYCAAALSCSCARWSAPPAPRRACAPPSSPPPPSPSAAKSVMISSIESWSPATPPPPPAPPAACWGEFAAAAAREPAPGASNC
mmetsp:Transcript_57/g.152  ORF Transcript_57/g.152 Transcript_57/m.152 type:complete len:237 (+) Transcript_57:503-1213(+)